MADRDMYATTDLRPLLADRGVVLSREQVYRLVTRVPERLSLQTLGTVRHPRLPTRRSCRAGRCHHQTRNSTGVGAAAATRRARVAPDAGT